MFGIDEMARDCGISAKQQVGELGKPIRDIAQRIAGEVFDGVDSHPNEDGRACMKVFRLNGCEYHVTIQRFNIEGE